MLVPALWPAIVAAGCSSSRFPFDDFALSFFTTGEDAQPLPVRIWSMIRGLADDQRGRHIDDGRLDQCGRSGGADPEVVRTPRGVKVLTGAEEEMNGEGSPVFWRRAPARRSGSKVTKRFGDFVAVDQVDLLDRPGRVLSLLGPSGCGKTTTLRMLAGFEVPSEGRIPARGRVAENAAPPAERQHGLPELRALFEHLDVNGNVAFGLKRKKVPKEETTRRRGARAGRPFSRASARPNELLAASGSGSTGAGPALVNRPRCCCSTSRSAPFDLKLRRQMQIELKAIQREVGITFVYVTHDQEEAPRCLTGSP